MPTGEVNSRRLAAGGGQPVGSPNGTDGKALASGPDLQTALELLEGIELGCQERVIVRRPSYWLRDRRLGIGLGFWLAWLVDGGLAGLRLAMGDIHLCSA